MRAGTFRFGAGPVGAIVLLFLLAAHDTAAQSGARAVDVRLMPGQTAVLEVDGRRLEGITAIQSPASRRGSDGSWELSLERESRRDGVTFASWLGMAGFGGVASSAVRKNGSIIIYDSAGHEVRRYTMTNAWPKALEIGTMKAGDTSVAVEVLTIAVEAIEPGVR